MRADNKAFANKVASRKTFIFLCKSPLNIVSLLGHLITEAIKEAMLEGWQPLSGAYCYWDSLIESSWYGQAMVK